MNYNNYIIAPHPIGDSIVCDFESKIGFRLPGQYRDFLLATNGGGPLHRHVDFRESDGDCSGTSVQTFKGLVDVPGWRSLEQGFSVHITGCLGPKNALPIASDDGGGGIFIVYKWPEMWANLVHRFRTKIIMG